MLEKNNFFFLTTYTIYISRTLLLLDVNETLLIRVPRLKLRTKLNRSLAVRERIEPNFFGSGSVRFD
jgi:hypothetical protein